MPLSSFVLLHIFKVLKALTVVDILRGIFFPGFFFILLLLVGDYHLHTIIPIDLSSHELCQRNLLLLFVHLVCTSLGEGVSRRVNNCKGRRRYRG